MAACLGSSQRPARESPAFMAKVPGSQAQSPSKNIQEAQRSWFTNGITGAINRPLKSGAASSLHGLGPWGPHPSSISN